MTPLAVALAAGAGAVCRYLVDQAVTHRSTHRSGARVLPLGTLTVNVTGSLVLGFLVGLGLYHGLDGTIRAVTGSGFVGAYTTFSTFTYETVRLIEAGSIRPALLNTAANTLIGLTAATCGLALAAAV